MAWLSEQWTKVRSGTAKFAAGSGDRVRNFKWRNPSKPVLIWTGSILGVLVATWVTLNILLANPSTGTPMINWAIGTFGDQSAKVQTGHLEHPFSDRFVLRSLDWPGTIEAKAVQINYDLFGFLPGRVLAKCIWVRDGQILVEEKEPDETKTTFNPQQYVDEIDAANVDIKFTRNDKPRVVKIVTANGSFAKGNVRAEATSGKNKITFDGLQRDWGGSLKGNITVEGQNLKDLAEIAGASAPDTPPFNIKGALSVNSQTWSVENLTGRMGDSDMGGLVRINLTQKKPMLIVDLTSKQLDFDDLGVVFGIPVGTGKGETENAEQVKAKQVHGRSARLIPDARIDFTRLAAVNADINFVAAKVTDAPMGINALTLNGSLRDSVLNFKQALVKTSTGDLDAKINVNATKDPAVTKTTGQLKNVAINRFIDTPMVRGSLNGTFALSLTGSGFREAAGSATGEVGLWSNNSELAKFAVEGAGLDLGEILLLWATEDKKKPEYIKSRCLAANIAFKDGQATLQPAVIDNDDSLVAASGGVNFKTESVDIEVFARPHDFSIGTISGDIRVTGTLRNLSFQALNEKTAVQAGLSALLASIAGPLGLLPFVQTGGEPDAPCATLLADAKETSTKRNPAQNALPKKG